MATQRRTIEVEIVHSDGSYTRYERTANVSDIPAQRKAFLTRKLKALQRIYREATSVHIEILGDAPRAFGTV